MSIKNINIMYDVIVVGAGVVGSSTAYHLAKRGKKTLLIEQFPLPHSRGSSHGARRITRKAYRKDFYTEMMKESYNIIKDLEDTEGVQLFLNHGMMSIGPKTEPIITSTIASLTKHSLPFEHYTAEEMKRKYPMMSFPDNFECVLDGSGGILRADKMLAALQSLFRQFGGTILDTEQVLNVTPGEVVTVSTKHAEYQSRSLVLTLGPWAPRFLAKLGVILPLQVVRITVCYWREKQSGQHDPQCLPPFSVICRRGPRGYPFHFFGLPAEEYPDLVKVCLHSGPVIDPDERDKPDNTATIQRITELVRDHLPMLEPKPVITESCIYTNTPDEDLILDVHPKWKNIVIGAGFSGHGFKFSPVVGKILMELTLGKSPSYDVTHFKMDRFNNKAKL